MNSITGLAVLKNSFSWKFSKYPRFHKKVKLQLQEKSEPAKKAADEVENGELTIPYVGEESEDAYTVVGLSAAPFTDSADSADSADSVDSAGVVLSSPCWRFEPGTPSADSDSDHADYSTVDYSSVTLEPDGPLYENTIGYIDPQSPILLSYSAEDDVEDHIYDCVDESRPADIFLSLVNGEGSTISPDPNIYEVPPGAIFNSDSCFEELFPLRNISPPDGFQDKLTWERLHLITNGEDDNEAIYSIPFKFSLNGSAIARPKKKKHRPALEELLNQIAKMKESEKEDVLKGDNTEENVVSLTDQEITKDISFKNDSSPTVRDDCAITIGSFTSSKEVIVDSINHVVPNNLTVLTSTDDLPELLSPPSPKEFTSIIEISGDGTWNTAKIPASHLESSRSTESAEVTDGADQDFLSSSPDARAKHVTLAYSGQFYTGNCPVASIKPMKHEDELSVEVKKNIGAQIMEKYEEDRKKLIETKNLPEVSLLDVDESLEEIQMERRKIIESQAVRAKRIDSWIKGRSGCLESEEDLEEDSMDATVERTFTDTPESPKKPTEDPEKPSETSRKPFPSPCEESLQDAGSPQKSEDLEETSVSVTSPCPETVNMYLDENGEVVYDSIIQNKNKIKSYWEQLMLAAELANQRTPPKSYPHQHQHTTVHHPSPANAAPPPPPQNSVTHKIHSPDPSEAEYFDALSHVSAVQTPDLLENNTESLKLMETVVERDIRIQQERELALILERQKALKSVKEKTIKSSSMKEKEEELRQTQQPDEAYLSIPTTDEGNFSEYGSEDKEDHSPDGSRVMSPVGTTGISAHHRTQSLDSMSSGHSSGSGTASHPDLSITKPERRQTFGPVKPLDEPDDMDILSYVKNNTSSLLKEHSVIVDASNVEDISCLLGYEKETPIEREIRLAKEREEELRREKLISASPLAPNLQKFEPEKKKETSPQVAHLRVTPALQRVQHEIELASQREKELKQWSSDDLQKEVSSTKLVVKPVERNSKPIPTVQIEPVKEPELAKTPQVFKNGGASPKIYIQNPQQKGLMKRFLASRGKMGSTPRLNSLNTSPSATLPSLKTAVSPSSLLSEPFFSFTSLVQTKDGEEPLNLGARPGYKSAEDKIQSELREMKRREEELRQQRRSSLYSARSQPDLLNMTNDPMMDRETNHVDDEEMTQLPNTSKLRSALSVQNLLDVDDKRTPRRMPKRRSALIEQWENRIQNSN